jgi:hypothetical protein
MLHPRPAGPALAAACVLSAALAAVALEAACTPSHESGSAAADPSAWSSTSPPPSTPAPSATPTSTRWEHADRLGTFRRVGPRARSEHLGGEREAEVLVNEAAAAYPALGPERRLGAGAVLVEELHRPGSPDIEAYFAMARRPDGRWEYLIVTPAGEVDQRGRLALCERCHAEAPHDHVFGRPR